MKTYNVDEAFEILKENKITTHKESIRRWLRTGVMKGIAPTSRKEGWQIPERELREFIQQRLPESYTTMVAKEVNDDHTTSVVNGEMKDQIRAEMWKEIARKNLFEGFIEIKKSLVRECIQHKKYSKELENEVWQRCISNSREYSKPRIPYLLEAFKFEGQRFLLDKSFESLEEQIMFSIIEYVRKNRKNNTTSDVIN
jgi:hypothetical protein